MKKMLNILTIEKIVAVFTTVAFLFTGIFSNYAYASLGQAMSGINNINFATPIIPTSLGKITSAKYFDSEDIIINIQDLHCHAETQRQIASIIGYIDNTYNLNNVYLEGAFENVDTSWLSAFNDGKNGTKILEGLIDSGKLSGTEYYSIINNKKNFVLGIENEKIYKENIKLLATIFSLQPEINAVCNQLENEINKIKRDYSGKQARKLAKIVKSFNDNKINAKDFYKEISLIADTLKVSLKKYNNITLYISLLNSSQNINNKKIQSEFNSFISEIKNRLTYEEYIRLLQKSNEFRKIDDIAIDLIYLNRQYSITKNLKLSNFETYLSYLEFNQNINPVKLVQEQDALINELYTKSGRTKYEKEVAFLSEFIPTIKQYFTADISADEYHNFEKNYNLFKNIWPSYFSENILKNLEKYQKLLSVYHENNIVRDKIFADNLISKQNINSNILVSDTNLAIDKIRSNINNKKIKLVVTGGFHTKGLEKIFEQQKISYVIVTPKITQPVEQAKQIYVNNVMYYSNILKNTINLEPLTQEPLNISFPKILNTIFTLAHNNSFEGYSKEDLKQAIKGFVQNYIIEKQDTFYGDVEILNWDILSTDFSEKIEFYVEYKDNANKSTISNVKYRFIDGQIIPYSNIDIDKTLEMLERVTTNKYSLPAIVLEPTDATRKKIYENILKPLQKVSGNMLSLMPFEMLHMTVGVDSTPLSQEQIELLIKEENKNAEIFNILDVLGEDFFDSKTTMAATLKLMPDGVIICEIADRNLLEKMFKLRAKLTSSDAKYKTPSIVHMTIGRITNKELLSDSEQSRQELANLLEKINETIYEINKKNALSKIKTTFTLKSCYTSYTGDKVFSFKRIFPKKESLTILKNLMIFSKSKLSIINKIIVAPIIEEVVFRYIPFTLTSLIVSNPASIIPAIITSIIGILGFSIAHPLADKVTKQLDIRNWTKFILPSAIFTGIYITVSIAFPQIAFLAPIVTITLHSINNILSLKGKTEVLSLIDDKKNIEQEAIDLTIKNLKSISGYDNVKEIIEKISNLPKDISKRYDIIVNQAYLLFEMLKKYKSYKDVKPAIIAALVPLSTMINGQGTEQLLIYSIVDMFFDKDADGKKYEIISNIADIMAAVYPINPKFITNILNILLDKGFISKDEEIPFSINERLRKYGYDGLKQYYLTISADEEVDFELSEVLKDNIAKVNKNIIPQITNSEYKENIKNALFNVDELTDKINTKNIALLEYQLNILLEQAIKLTETDKNISFEILDIVLSICKQILVKNKDINSRTLKINKFKNMIIDSFDINSDNERFNSIVSKLISMLKPARNDDTSGSRDSFNKTISDMLKDIAIFIYSPIASGQLQDELSQEYQYRKKQCLDIFRALSIARLTDKDIYYSLFNSGYDRYSDKNRGGIGFTQETLEIFINAAKSGNLIFYLPTPDKDFVFGNTEQLGKTIADSIEYIDPSYMLFEIFNQEIAKNRGLYGGDISSKENIKRKELAVSVIKNLLDLVNNESADLTKRKRAVKVLLNIVAKGISDVNIKDLPLSIDQVRSLALKFDIPTYLYLGNTYIESSDGYEEYNFTPLLNSIPQNIFDENPLVSSISNFVRRDRGAGNKLQTKNPVITEIIGKTDETKEEVKTVLFRFEVLQKILSYNTSVLASLDKINDLKNYDNNMSQLLITLQEMINELKKINLEHGNSAQMALDNIEDSLKDPNEDKKSKVEKNMKLSEWTTNSIKDIEEIHTLINAIHQTSILDFKQEMVDVRDLGIDTIQTISASQKSEIIGYNLSNFANSSVVKFISKLATRKFPRDKIDDFVCKDDLVVWTTRLNAHSVDIFFNFGEVDRGINVYYRERPVSSADIGKKERVRYFKEILEYLGFHVDTDTQETDGLESYGLKAALNKNYGMNEAMDLIDIATHVVEIFKFSTNVDYDLKYRHNEVDYKNVFDNWLKKAIYREAWYGVEVNNWGFRMYGYGQGGRKLDAFPYKKSLNPKSLNAILSYLGCDLLPKETSVENLMDPRYLDKHFNKPIERAYVEGKIVFNNEGILVKNKGYDIINSMINEISNDITETSKQARIINLVDSYEFNTNILANIGSFVVVSSIMELENGDRLFVKSIMDSNTKRMKYAIAELVTNTTRTKLNSEELINLLKRYGYEISEQEWMGNRERMRIRNKLSRDIQIIESRTIPCTPISDGEDGGSIVGDITLDKVNANENSILIVPDITPDDIEVMKKVKGMIAIDIGVLSHVAITIGELKKPSVIFNGATLMDNKIEVLYYLASGKKEIVDKQFQVQKIKANRIQLKEGARVLMNGEIGMVLLFNDIKISFLNELQEYIEKDDSEAILNFMNVHSQNKNINRFVEYVYFQVIGNSKTTNVLDSLFSNDMPDVVKYKINKLNDGYIQDKIQSISEAIENLKTIDNVNIAYTIIGELNKKIRFIKTVGKREDIENLKEQIQEIEKDIKEKLNSYMQDFIKELYSLLNKKVLDIRDTQKILVMLNNVEIYKFFVNEFETSDDLLQKKSIIETLVPMIKDKLNSVSKETSDISLKEEISLFNENAGDTKRFGSKCAMLARMFKLLKDKNNTIVPEGIGISVNVMQLLFRAIGQEDILNDFENAIKNKDKARALELAKEISQLIDYNNAKKAELENKIKQQLDKFIKPNGKYSVRSSGVGEDAANNAFAGMGETKLNVFYDNVYDNVKECWKSFFAERAIEYMITSGQVVKPAVLVQEMVDSEKSGVVFTRDKYGNGRINTLYGQGQGLVSGKFTPDSILFDMNSGEIIEYSVANKPFKLVTKDDGGLREVAVGEKAKARTLDSVMVQKIAEITKILENYFGYPLDIEFSIKGETLYVLQARSITTLDNTLDKTKDTDNVIEIKQDKEIKHEISLIPGNIQKGQEFFVSIANPLNTTQSIPIYIKSVDSKITEFIVDSKYFDIVNNAVLGRLLLNRINTDPVILNKLNAGLFNYESGEIGLLPVLDDRDLVEPTIDNSIIELEIENVKQMLTSA